MTVRFFALSRAGLRLWVALACLAFVPQRAAAQTHAAEAAGTLPFGFQVFHSLLESRGVATTTDIQRLHDSPASSILILLGDVNRNELLARMRLKSFLARGGCVLMATDQAAWADGLCLIKSGPVLVEPGYAYQDYDDCPRITSLDPTHPLLNGVGELIANRSGTVDKLFHDEGRWRQLARLPAAEGEAEPVLMAVMQSNSMRGRGRMLVLADHSLLINGMVLHGDNARFMLNLTNWLTLDRRDTLYIAVDGELLASNGLPSTLPPELPPLPLPDELPPVDLKDLKDLPAEMLLPFANQLLVSMEDAGIHNEILANQPRGVSRRLYRRFLYFLSGLIALLILLRQLLRSAQRVERPLPANNRSLLAARVEQYQRSGHLRLAMIALASDLMRTLSGSDLAAYWYPAVERVRIDAPWMTRLRLRRTLRRLAKLAVGPPHPGSFLASDFKVLSRRIAQLHELHQQQRIHWPAS